MFHNLLYNDKSMVRAIAFTYEHHKTSVVRLLNKYGAMISPNLTNELVISDLIDKLKNNKQFANEFSELMIKVGAINLDGSYKNATGLLGGIIEAISNLGSTAINKVGIKGELANQASQTASENTKSVLALMSQEEIQKQSANKNIYIIGGVVAVSLIGLFGIIIYKKTK